MHTFTCFDSTITDALNECGPGHPAHIKSWEMGRVVAIRTGNDDGTFNLTFSDPKVDLRSEGDTAYNVTRDNAMVVIRTFLSGGRFRSNRSIIALHVNQKDRDCEILKRTPTRLRLQYTLPRTGTTQCWRKYYDIGNYRYVRNYD